jgi:thiol-disulfide isomerase/thioredoxin
MSIKKLFAVVAVLSVVLGPTCASAASFAVGRTVPAYDIALADGTTHITPSSEHGRVLVINFWATWCGPCRKEMPELDAFYRRYKDRGVDVVAISVDETEDLPQAHEIMRAFAMPGAYIDKVRHGFGRLWRIPVTFVIDRDGVLRRDGWKAEPVVDMAILEKSVQSLLTPATPATPAKPATQP